jgi:hypothetical protein
MAGFITMATTTPNYGWPVPTSTDFVKDGATAIEALGDAIDATVFALPAPVSGLNLISTAAFSGAVSHSFGSDASPIFTSTYRNYRVIIDNVKSTTSDQTLHFRLRANTTDLTSSVYDIQHLYALGGTIGGSRSSNQTSAFAGSITADARTGTFVFDITTPQLAIVKNIISSGVMFATGEGPRMHHFYSMINSAVAYNGFTIYAGTNISGQISIYGYDI